MNEFSTEDLNLIARLSGGMTPSEFQEFRDCIRDHKPKDGITSTYIYACHDAVTGQGVEFISSGDAQGD